MTEQLMNETETETETMAESEARSDKRPLIGEVVAARSIASARTVIAALVVALLVALAAAGWLYTKNQSLSDEAEVRDAGEAAEAAARDLLVDITTYSYESIDDDVAWLEKWGTEDFQAEYGENLAQVEEATRAGRIVAKGNVVDSAYRADSTDEVVVLAFLDQTLTSRGQDPVTELHRVTLTMVAADDGWRVDALELSGVEMLEE